MVQLNQLGHLDVIRYDCYCYRKYFRGIILTMYKIFFFKSRVVRRCMFLFAKSLRYLITQCFYTEILMKNFYLRSFFMSETKEINAQINISSHNFSVERNIRENKRFPSIFSTSCRKKGKDLNISPEGL